MNLLCKISMVVFLSCFASSAFGYQTTSCHQYVIKVQKQLDACQPGVKPCFEAPFHHALYPKNYGYKYSHCKQVFDAEVATRMNIGNASLQGEATPYVDPSLAPMTSEASLEEVPVAPIGQEAYPNPNMMSPPPAPYSQMGMVHKPGSLTNISVGPNCAKALGFFEYTTKSCKTTKCVDQQFSNMGRIAAFQECTPSLTHALSARRAPLPTSHHYNAWTMPQQYAH